MKRHQESYYALANTPSWFQYSLSSHSKSRLNSLVRHVFQPANTSLPSMLRMERYSCGFKQGRYRLDLGWWKQRSLLRCKAIFFVFGFQTGSNQLLDINLFFQTNIWGQSACFSFVTSRTGVVCHARDWTGTKIAAGKDDSWQLIAETCCGTFQCVFQSRKRL